MFFPYTTDFLITPISSFLLTTHLLFPSSFLEQKGGVGGGEMVTSHLTTLGARKHFEVAHPLINFLD